MDKLKAVDWFKILIGIATALLLYIVSWGGSSIVVHARQLSSIEASRFTSKDGLEVWKEIGTIKTALASLPAKFPPDDYRRMVDDRFANMEKVIMQNHVILQKLAIDMATLVGQHQAEKKP